MEKAESDDSVVGIVLTGKGRSFIEGADISEFGQQIEGPSIHDAFEKLKNQQNLLLQQLTDLLLVVDWKQHYVVIIEYHRSKVL